MRAVRRAQALLPLVTSIGQQATGKTVDLSCQVVSQLHQRCGQGGRKFALAEAPRCRMPPAPMAHNAPL